MVRQVTSEPEKRKNRWTSTALYILSDAGVVTCVAAATGEQLWQERLGGQFYASPVCVNGRIYTITRDGEVIVLEALMITKILTKTHSAAHF